VYWPSVNEPSHDSPERRTRSSQGDDAEGADFQMESRFERHRILAIETTLHGKVVHSG
jgi:hypothetical protein